MTLQEFLEKQRNDLDEFQKDWILGMSTQDWPTELEYPEWQDQLRTWWLEMG